ncbi:hypothetical protein H9Q74_007704 [Fusarium xylarioides]|nr:hypothetical protein H9Q71_007198 [Fusarium xylarioides]KAG5822211.1 hypothetical protein H9Q74_007704 [Fusarium xylarioides]
MATGLEALGAASAVVQLIAFAGSLVSLSFKIYDGIPTPENELEEYSTKMTAACRVQTRGNQVPQGTQGTQVGDKLSKVSQECINAATELRKEAQTLTKRRQKGKMFKAVYSAFRAESHKTKLNQLNESLNKCKELMETELLLKICDQDTAIAQQQSQGFRSLEVDVQNLILKIAEGYTRVDQLVSIEAQATRDAINTHVTSEFKALGIKNISDNQRQRLLKSLKPEEIRERYNAVLPSSDACFERVFASYERVCRNDPGYKAWKGYEQAFDDGSENDSENKSENEMSEQEYEESDWTDESDEVDEIDQIWECYSTWLQSDDKLFWIRGKPGSGKSTLIKFIINNDNTKRLLGSWHPNTRILSHFFWKIGSEPQNSIRGLLCSLLYNLLSVDDDAIDQVLREFKFSESKDYYKEWSSSEAEKILWFLLDALAHPTCIFVDGLDEILDKDGYQALVSVVQRLTTCRGVKVCVSSRPETELVRRLENMKVKNLRLDDLTKPEMAVYLQKEFEKLPKENSADLPIEQFTKKLLEKAQGVFLWLCLASKSITHGIMNGDDHETLSKRVEELPEELESLYQKMWERLNGGNRVYRQTAARYFRFAIAEGWNTDLLWTKEDELFGEMDEPNLVQLSLAVQAEDGLIFPPKGNEMRLSELDTLCAATEIDIQIRCAGMLQVGRQSAFEDIVPDAMYPLMRSVQFIHRTAHDFLVDTEHGQSILNHRSNETALVDEHLKLLKSRLSLANTYYRELEVVSDCRGPIFDCNQLNKKGANPEAILRILRTIKDLYEDGALGNLYPAEKNTPSFPCVMAYYLDSFDDFIISSFMPTPSPELATRSLHELALASRYFRMCKTTARIIRGMIELGGDAHAAKRSKLSFELTGHGMPTAFELFFCGVLNLSNHDARRNFLDVSEVFVQTCPDLHRRVMAFLGEHGFLLTYPLQGVGEWVAVEVDLQFLISQLLTSADLDNIPAEFNYRIRELAASFTKPHARVRHVVCRGGNDLWTLCYRILNQEPCTDVIDSFGHDKKCGKAVKALVGALDAMSDPIDDSTHSESSFASEWFKEVPIQEEMDMLIQEGIGLYREEDMNIS